jgi:cytoplasmic iron level regulating protein YaaA (DUF328/UPF0246 family)
MTPEKSVKTGHQPELIDHAKLLIKALKKMSAAELGRLMKLSDKLAELNASRYQSWRLPFDADNAAPAIYAFQGDVYVGVDALSLDARTVKYADKHLRMLSGLYGVLRPLDWMQAYRLEMGTALENSRGKDLYIFWGELITAQLNADLKSTKSTALVNLASQEYFKSVKAKLLTVPVITPVFKDQKNGKFKIISFYAKKARGMMARHMMLTRSKTLEDLQTFSAAGYQFDAKGSDDTNLIFTRTEKAAEKAANASVA